MIWGVSRYEWTRKFAWWPVKLMDRRWAWFEWVEATSYYRHDVPINAHFTFPFARVYRLAE